MQQLDRGRAWAVLTGATLMLFVLFGIAYSYGQFLTPMAHAFGVGTGAASVLFSLTSLLFFCLGVVTAPLAERFGLRVVFGAGALVFALGLFATAPWQAYAGYGLGVGLGIGAMYVPVIGALGRWFARYRSVATGIAFCGIGLGTVAGPPLIALLVAESGWRTAFRICAVVAIVALLLILLLLAPPPEPAATVRGRGRANGFGRLYVSALLLNCALYVPYVHLSPAAMRLGLSPVRAAVLVSVIGATSIAGRLLLGLASARLRTMTLYLGCYGCVALSLPIWASAQGYPQLLVFAAVFGFGYGGYIALTPVVLAELYGARELPNRLGLIYTAVGIGASLGPAATGFLVQATGSYPFAGYLLTASAAGGLVLAFGLRVEQGQGGDPGLVHRAAPSGDRGDHRGALHQGE